VQVSDLSGNVQFLSWQFDVVLEPPAPPVLTDLPTITNRAFLSVSGSVPNQALGTSVSVTLYVNGVVAGVATSSGTFEIPNVRLTEGGNELTAVAQDSAGNLSERSATQTVTLDTTRPTVILDPLPAAIAAKTVQITGTAYDNLPGPVRSLVVIVNGAATPLPTDTPTFRYEAVLTDGTNTVRVQATDAAGNTAESDEATIAVDTTPPTSAPSSVTALATPDARGLAISWAADRDAATYSVYRSDAAITSASGMFPVAANVRRTSYTDTSAPSGRTIYYAVVSVDAAGNSDPAVVSPSLGVAFLRSAGGEATLPDGTRLVVADLGLFANSLQTGTLELQAPTDASAPPRGIERSARRVTARTSFGAVLAAFNRPATLTLPVPAGVPIAGDSPRLLRETSSGAWERVPAQVDESTRTVQAQISGSGTFYLVRVSPTPWDVNDDGSVNIVDLVRVALRFGESVAYAVEDTNDDGVINIVDLVTIALRFGETTQTAAAAPSSLSGEAVRVWLEASRTEGGEVEVRVLADASTPLGGYSLRVALDERVGSIAEAGAGDALGEHAFWLPIEPAGNDRLIGGARLGASATTVSDRGSFVLARLYVRAHGRNEADAVVQALRISEGQFSDGRGRLLPYRVGPPVALTAKPLATALYPNYPNPFNPETWIPFSLAQSSEVRIRIYDVRGLLVRTLDLGRLEPGNYRTRGKAAHWDGANEEGERVASGVYFYRMDAGTFSETRRLVVIK
jgi:hypothetical protein